MHIAQTCLKLLFEMGRYCPLGLDGLTIVSQAKCVGRVKMDSAACLLMLSKQKNNLMATNMKHDSQ